MSRDESLYQIYYSYLLHRSFAILTGRIDKFMTFLLLLLGSSVMASIGNSVLIGFLIAAIAAMQNAFKPSSSSEASRIQAARYLNLYTENEDLNRDELKDQKLSIQEDDLHPWLSVENIAEYRADIFLKNESSIVLNKFEKLIGFIC